MIPHGFDDDLMRRLFRGSGKTPEWIVHDMTELEARCLGDPAQASPVTPHRIDHFPVRHGKTSRLCRLMTDEPYYVGPNRGLMFYDFEGRFYTKPPAKPSRPLELVPSLQRLTRLSTIADDFEAWGQSPLVSASAALREYTEFIREVEALLHRETSSVPRRARAQRAFAAPYGQP